MHKVTYFGWDFQNPAPLDKRFIQPDLVNLDTSLPITYRYTGLIFYVTSENKLYWFDSNILTPTEFNFGVDVIFSHVNSDEDYSTLIADLDATGIIDGKIVTVLPLGVSFIYDSLIAQWKYHYGKYRFTLLSNYLTIPVSLRGGNAIVKLNTDDFVEYQINPTTKLLDDFFISVTELPLTPLNKRFYKIGDTVHYIINGEILEFQNSANIYTGIDMVADTEFFVVHSYTTTNIMCWCSFIDSEDNNHFVTITPTNIDATKIYFMPTNTITDVTIIIKQI